MSNATRTVSYADLEGFLARLGFSLEHPQGSYMLFRYASPEILIILPPRRGEDLVDAAHLIAVRKHILENGLLDDASFEKILWGTESTVAPQ
jgi:predicted RNA binding protein YcfA (HicA-like mRNA interferase family)